MNMVIATGCPYSAWEMVVPTLTDAGLESTTQAFSEWHDQMLAISGVIDPLQLRQSLQPDARMEGLLASLSSSDQAMAACHADSRSLWLLDFWAARYPHAKFLLFFTSADTGFASALMSGIEPTEFLDGWKASNRHLIQFLRRHRQRALLLNAELASQHPEAFIDAGRLLGLSLQLSTEWVGPKTPALPELARFLAKRIVADDPSIAALQMELEARAQPLGDSAAEDSQVALDKLVQCYLQMLQDHGQVRSQLQHVQEALERIALDKQQVEEDHETTRSELQQLKAHMVEAEQARKKLEGANQSLEAASKESLEENALLLKQLHAVQEELEKVFLEKQEVEKAHKAAGVELQQRQACIMQAEQAREKLEATNQALEASGKDALVRGELLAQQLQQVQEDLESAVLQRQALEQTEKANGIELQQLKARMVEAEQARKKLEGTNQSLEAASKESLEENALLLMQLHAVQEELEHYFLKYRETLTRQEVVPEGKAPVVERIPEADGERQPVVQRKKTTAWTTHTLIRGLVKPFKRQDKNKEKVLRQVDVLNKSGLFDRTWYLSTYPEVASAGLDPTEHYVRFGAAEGRNPSPKFDTVYYLQTNPDVAAAGVNPLLHYIQFGISEGRQACSEKSRF